MNFDWNIYWWYFTDFGHIIGMYLFFEDLCERHTPVHFDWNEVVPHFGRYMDNKCFLWEAFGNDVQLFIKRSFLLFPCRIHMCPTRTGSMFLKYLLQAKQKVFPGLLSINLCFCRLGVVVRPLVRNLRLLLQFSYQLSSFVTLKFLQNTAWK